MVLKEYNPTSPAQRYMTRVVRDAVTSERPDKKLSEGKKRISCRNNQGRITVRRRGGGHKRLYRFIDFRREKHGIVAVVKSIEYDPNRSSYIALVAYADGEKRYIIATSNMKVGDRLESGEKAEIKEGNALPIRLIPQSTQIHNIELKKEQGGVLVKSAGSYAELMACDGDYAHIKLPSGEVRLVHSDCYATIGQVSNTEHENVSIGKAGRNRWLGKRPKVRGVAMNPVDHPHGGGEGKAGAGNPHPVTPWGLNTKGKKTRKKKLYSKKYIVKRRK